MALERTRSGVASAVVAWALALAFVAWGCGSDRSAPPAPPEPPISDTPPDAPTVQPPAADAQPPSDAMPPNPQPPDARPPVTPPPPAPQQPPSAGQGTPGRPDAGAEWTRVLDEDAQTVQLASGGAGSVVAVTRGPDLDDSDGRLLVQRLDAAGTLRWTMSRLPACSMTLEPLGASDAGELFFAARARCDDPLPGLWPVPLGRGAFVVLGPDGAFRRRIPIRSWSLAAVGPGGDIFAGEDRDDSGALTFRKRAMDGAVLWERTGFMGTKVSLRLAPTADGGSYVLRGALLTRVGADGTEAWTRSFPAEGRWLAILEDGAVAVAGGAFFGTEWEGRPLDGPGTGLLVFEADGTLRARRLLAGASVTGVSALPGAGVAVLSSEVGCDEILALGPRLETRWTRRLASCGFTTGPVSDPAAGTLVVGLIEQAPEGPRAAVLESLDPSGE